MLIGLWTKIIIREIFSIVISSSVCFQQIWHNRHSYQKAEAIYENVVEKVPYFLFPISESGTVILNNKIYSKIFYLETWNVVLQRIRKLYKINKNILKRKMKKCFSMFLVGAPTQPFTPSEDPINYQWFCMIIFLRLWLSVMPVQFFLPFFSPLN